MTSPATRRSPAHAPVYVSLASNIEPERHIEAALARLATMPLDIAAVSPFYITRAIGRPQQPDFYNGVVRIATALPPRELKFGVLREVEAALGRVRGEDPYAARPIDLDLLAFGGLVVDEPGLALPDADLVERPFVAAGVLALDPDFVVPGLLRRLDGCVPPEARAALTDASEFTRRMAALYNG